jgi:hypothetical protein
LRSFRPSRWQLKDHRLLALHQVRQQQDIAIRKLQGVVMGVQAVYIDLPEDRRFVVDNIFAPRPQTGARLTSYANDSSVPGSKQTATLMSSGAEKPDIPHFGAGAAKSTYKIIQLLPPEGDDFQYRIKSADEAAVPELKRWVNSLSPISAGRVLTF